MRGALMSEWLNPAGANLWEQVELHTYGTPDEDEDVLWYAHARVEQRSLPRDRAQPAPKKRPAALRRFPSALHRRRVG